MAQKNNANISQEVTPSKSTKKETVAPVYTVDEFAQAPHAIGAKSPDIVRAALKINGKAEYTEAEAKEIVKTFSKKEVK